MANNPMDDSRLSLSALVDPFPLPPMDRAAPGNLETATFAMG